MSAIGTPPKQLRKCRDGRPRLSEKSSSGGGQTGRLSLQDPRKS